MPAIKTVALAGASGSLGSAILNALLNADFIVTVLARPESSNTYAPAVKFAEIDYNNTESLKSALQGQDAVVSAVGYAGFQNQKALVDAAIAAGVQRVIPSEYGPDPDVLAARQLPVFADQVQVEEYLKQKTKGTSTSYTLVANNELFDWVLDHGFGVDIKNRKMTIFDGGNIARTATTLEFVARGVVGVLQHPAETANRVVRLHGAALTQNRVLEIVQRFTGKEGWEIEHASTVDREEQAYQMLQDDPSNWLGWAIPLLEISAWGERFGGHFSQNNDNDLLGLTELTGVEVEEIVQGRC